MVYQVSEHNLHRLHELIEEALCLADALDLFDEGIGLDIARNAVRRRLGLAEPTVFLPE